MAKILAIDDIQDNHSVLNALLTEAFPEIELVSALSGRKGIELCLAEKPDVVLLDIVMPEMDGFEVCQILKSNEATKTIPIIMITAARTDQKSRIKALEAGADAFLTKPIDESELTAQIKAMLRIKISEDLKLDENDRLKKMVAERTEALQWELNERKKTEELLQESELRFRLISSSISDISYSCETDLNGISTINWLYGATEEITGYTPEELIEMKCWGELVVDEDFPVFKTHIVGVLPGFSDECELRIRKKDGSIVWIQATSECIQSKDGRFTNVLYGALVDITKKKLTEQTLRENESQFRAFFEKAADAIFIADIESGIVVDANEAASRMMLRSHDELVGIHQTQLHPPVIKDFAEDTFIRHTEYIKSRPNSNVLESKVIRADGVVIPVEILASAVDYNGKPCIMGTFRDTTEREKSEKQIQESEAKYRYMFEHNPQPMWIYDHDTLEILEVNHASTKIYGYSREEFLSMTIKDIRPPEDIILLLEDVEASRQDENSIGEWRHLKKSGEIMNVEISATSINYNGRKARHVLIKDITKRKRAEEAIRKSESMLRTLIESAPFEVWARNKDGIGILENENQVRHFGSILGKTPVDEAIAPEVRQLWISNNRRAMNGEIVNDECIYLVDGVERTFHQILSPIIVDGSIEGITGFNIDITEQKVAEELLRESEYFFKESQRAAFVGSYKFDFIADLWTTSEVLDQIFGIDKSFIKNLKSWIDILHPDDREKMAQYFKEEVIGKKQPFNKEYRIINLLDGDLRWVLGLGKLNLDAEGTVVEMIGTIQDITERKLAELARNETFEFTQSLLKTIPFGMDIVDEEGNLMFQSSNLENVFTTKAMGCKCWELYRDDKTQCNSCPLNDGIEIGKTSTNEISDILGGRVFEISHTGMMFKGKRAMLEIFQDITERKLAEQKLKESQQLFQGLFNASPDAIVLIDPHHPTVSWPIVDCNEAACRMNGYSREELIGQSIDILNTTTGSSDERIEYLENLRKHNSIQKETLHRHKDGHIIPIEVSTTVITIGGNEMVLGIDRDITDRKQTEQALFESESRYKSFISQISEGVYRFESVDSIDVALPVEEQIDLIYDQMCLAECNKAFLEMYGMTYEKEIIGNSMLAFHGGRDNSLNRKTLRDFIRDGYRIENAVTEEVNHLGQTVYFSNNSLGIVENNQLIRIWGTQADISEKKRTDQIQHVLYTISNAAFSSKDLPDLIKIISEELGKLLDSTNFFIAFYDEKTDMLSTIYETDEKDEISSWPADKSITGYVIKHKKPLLINESELMKMCDDGEIELFGTPSKVWLGVPLYSDKKVAGALVVQSYNNPNAYSEKDLQILEFISHQISVSIERKKTDQELKLLGKAFEQSPVTIAITDRNGNIEYVNPKFSETTGYTLDEVKGKNPRILQSGDQSKEYYKNLWDTILAGNDWVGEFHNKRKNGESYWESAVISPITNERGEIAFFLALKEDITEKKKMIEDLIYAREAAEESDRLKSAFLANMSHEIRTPLNAIIGFSELIRDPAFEAEQQDEFAQLINDSGTNLLSILSDIMDISKIEAGQLTVIKRKLSVTKLITSIQREFVRKANKKGIELRLMQANPNDAVEIMTDETKIRQIIVNFLSNAIKFTETGYIELGIEPEANSVRIYVKDTGIGIPKAYHEKVFERFRQVETSHTRKYGGNGLGLCISKNLIELLDGTIGMESEEGKGSMFFITLPKF